MVGYESQNRALAPILHNRTSITHVRTAQDHFQSLKGSRDVSAPTWKKSALEAPNRLRACRDRAPRHARHAPRAAHPCVQREWGLSIAPWMVHRLEGQRANGPVTRASSTRSATGIGSGGFAAPIRSPRTVSVTPAVALMRFVSASTTASTLQVAMGVKEASSRGRWVPESTCHRAGSARTRAHAATEGAPCRGIASPICSRPSLECEEPIFTVTVNEAAYLRAARQKSRKQSRASARIG